MIRGLIEKEFRQHGSLILFMIMLLTGGLILIQRNDLLMRSGGSIFAAISWLLIGFVPPACLVLGSALVAGEFRHRTQLFLEGLPLPRWLMLVVKYALGLGVALFSTAAMLLTAFLSSPPTDAMTTTFALLLLVKAIGWAWFCWAVCFAHAFLGRYRMFFSIALVIGLVAAQNNGIMVTRFGPFDLIGARFAYERVEWPATALMITVALCVGISAFGFMLGLVRDATVASMLSEKMSSREKITLTIFTLLVTYMVGTHAMEREQADPLHLPGSVDVALRAATVSAAAAVSVPTAEEERALKAHAASARDLLAGAADYLGCKKLPPLFLVHRRDFKEKMVEFSEDLDSRQGVLLRCNMIATLPTETGLRTAMLKRILHANQHYRLDSDTRGWALEGFAGWWVARENMKRTGLPKALADGKKHTLELAGLEVTANDLRTWLQFKKRVTEKQCIMVSGLGILALAQSDEAACRRFLSRVLGYSAPHDARASVHDWLNPAPAVLRKEMGLDYEELARRWNKVLRQAEEEAR